MSQEARNRKIADAIQRELSEVIRLELRDPRVSMVTLTDVEVARDNAHAKVFFTSLGTDSQVESCQQGLQSVRLPAFTTGASIDDSHRATIAFRNRRFD